MLFLFLLWELPAIIVMAVHERILRSRGKLFAYYRLGTWTYRLIGMATVWPLVMVAVCIALILKS